MTNFSNKRRLISSAIALLVCFSMLLGTTFAWFTDSVNSGVNQIQSGNLDVELWHSSYMSSAASSQWGVGFGYSEADGEKVDQNTQLFLSADDQTPILWEPGATAVENFRITNEGTLALKFLFKLQVANATKTVDGKDLSDIIMLYIDKITYADNGVPMGNTIVSGDPLGDGYVIEGELLPGENYDFWVGLEWIPTEFDNDYNVDGGHALDVAVALVATQLSYEQDGYNGDSYDAGAEYPEIPAIPSKWNGGVDLDWYDPEADTYTLDSAEALAGLALLVDGSSNSSTYAAKLGNLPVSFEGKTVYLNNDVDLYAEDENGNRITFDPIGDDAPFTGVFDGQGHTISGLYQSGWDLGYEWGIYGSIGLFGELKDATVKNVTVSGALLEIEGGDLGGICGSATGTCVFENVTVENSQFGTYNNGNGGIIGWSGEGDYTFKNVTIAEDVVIAGLWGSFDSSLGGIVGQAEPGATYTFDTVDVACRIDAYNDCTASYDYYNYRMCGMLIGRMEETVATENGNYPDPGKYNLSFKNVTVTYGEWADYHYCRAEGARAKRVEAGMGYGGVDANYDHSVCTAHHMECIPFNQIFGGDQYAVHGLVSYDPDNITIIYNNDFQ